MLEPFVIDPIGIFGPVLGVAFSNPTAIIKRLRDGMPTVPRVRSENLDVRDLADLQVRAMRAVAATEQRCLAIGNGAVSLLDVAATLCRVLWRLGKPRACETNSRRTNTRTLKL